MSGGSRRAGSLRGLHVLVVAQDSDARELMKTVLDYAGALVTAASSGPATLSVLESVRPDVVIADLRSPDCDWLLAQMRKLPLFAETPTVAITDRGDRRALEAGFSAQLGAPVDPWELCEVVARLAGRGG